ncbi:MAG TPA: CPCC family cysteine-rich protein [Ktedonosporobacter sp.]|jgi:hypothetical protein|nr:CPCC family cysteine-rich protein [Ktedonosporobacter sp.]
MTEEMEQEARKKQLEQLFYEYIDTLNNKSVQAPAVEGVKYSCPCCGYKTLDERGGYDICPVCFWEDDGQDDADATTNRPFGPNHISLAQARENYKRIGACDERILQHVRPPLPEEL